MYYTSQSNNIISQFAMFIKSCASTSQSGALLYIDAITDGTEARSIPSEGGVKVEAHRTGWVWMVVISLYYNEY